MLLGSLYTVALSATVVLGKALLPRSSPVPCPQAYVCPEPRPYNPATFPDLGDSPGPDRFRCRIGWDRNDPNFAFCVYDKTTGNMLFSVPGGYESVCWSKGMANPACAAPNTNTKRGVPRRISRSAEPAAPRVSMERFKQRTPLLFSADYSSEDEEDEQVRDE